MRELLITIEGDSPSECGECQFLSGPTLNCQAFGDSVWPDLRRLPACIAAQEAAVKEGES